MCTFLSRVRNGDKPVNKETEGWWLLIAKGQTDRLEHFSAFFCHLLQNSRVFSTC